LRNADYAGQIAAVSKAQAVIEFKMDEPLSRPTTISSRRWLHARRGQRQTPQHVRR